MTSKEINYGNAKRAENRRGNSKKRKQPFFKAYDSMPEDYDLSEPVDKQLDALRVEIGFSRIRYYS